VAPRPLRTVPVLDVDRLGPVLPRVRIRPDGLLLRPWFSRPLLVPWTTVKGVRIAPAGRWTGPGAAPGTRPSYMVQVRLAGRWRRVGRARRVRHSMWPAGVREFLLGPGRAHTAEERILFQGYELIHTWWRNAGGTPGDEDDNWPPAA
jgi:hypothetical protein